MTVDFESFESYYGGTDVKTLREYAGQSKDDPERRAMFVKLAELKESGVIYADSAEGGKLHYVKSEPSA